MSSFASNAMISIITNLFQDEAVHETLNISNDMMLLDLLLTLTFLLFVFVITTQDTHEKAGNIDLTSYIHKTFNFDSYIKIKLCFTQDTFLYLSISRTNSYFSIFFSMSLILSILCLFFLISIMSSSFTLTSCFIFILSALFSCWICFIFFTFDSTWKVREFDVLHAQHIGCFQQRGLMRLLRAYF